MTRRLLIITALLASIAFLVAVNRVATRPPGTIATLDTLSLMERMLETPEFADARQAKIDELQGPLMALDTQLRGMVAQLQEMDPADPQAPAMQMQAQQVQQQFLQQQQDAQVGIDMFAAEQFADAFRQIREAADAMAAEQGYLYVMTSRFDDSAINTSSTALFVQEVLYRQALVAPDGTDLTDAIAARLGLPEPASDADADAEAPTDPMTPDP